MTKEEIGSVLKQLRISSGKTQKEVAEILGRKQQIVGHWETGYSQPDANTLFMLCDIYGTTVDDAFGFKKPRLSSSDLKFIEKYRSLDPYGQETVNMILDREICRFKQLRDAPDSPVVEFHDRSGSQMRIYSYMHKIASAGNGFYFDDIPTETMEAPYIDDADFIIGVSGDSMEPTYHDGDLVYVHKCQTVEIGDIGIFIVNGECYIKEAGEYGLVSHNRKYPIIPGSEHIICVGKVLGKVDR